MIRDFRKHFFTWFGIIGAAITLSAHWADFLQFADFIRMLLARYKGILADLWGSLGAVFGLTISKQVAILLSLGVFSVSMTVGARALGSRPIKPIVWRIAVFTVVFIFLVVALITLNVFEYFLVSQTIDNYVILILTMILYCIYIMDGDWKSRLINGSIFSLYFLVCLVTFFDALTIIDHFAISISDRVSLLLRLLIISGTALFVGLVILLPGIFANSAAAIKRVGFVLVGFLFIFLLSETSKLAERIGRELHEPSTASVPVQQTAPGQR